MRLATTPETMTVPPRPRLHGRDERWRKAVTSTEAVPVHRIVVGVDGSDSSMRALEWPRGKPVTGATLEPIITWEWPTSYGWAVPLPPDFNPATEAERLLGKAAETVRDAHPAIEVNPQVIEGHAAPVLVDASRRRPARRGEPGPRRVRGMFSDQSASTA